MKLRMREGTRNAQLNQVYAMGPDQSMKYELHLLLPHGKTLPMMPTQPEHQK